MKLFIAAFIIQMSFATYLTFELYNKMKETIKFRDIEIENQRLVIAEYAKYYEACLSNLNDMERTCHK